MRLPTLVGVLAFALALVAGSTGAAPNAELGPRQELGEALPASPLTLPGIVRDGEIFRVRAPLLATDGIPPPPLVQAPPTPPATVQASASAPTPVPEQLTRDQMVALLERTGWPPAQFDTAIRVSKCESGWRPAAINIGDQPDGLHSTGLFQLWSGWYRAAGLSYADWADPEVNAAAALVAWRSEGWRPWSCAR